MTTTRRIRQQQSIRTLLFTTSLFLLLLSPQCVCFKHSSSGQAILLPSASSSTDTWSAIDTCWRGDNGNSQKSSILDLRGGGSQEEESKKILRIRKPDGSMQRLQISTEFLSTLGDPNQLTVQQFLERIGVVKSGEELSVTLQEGNDPQQHIIVDTTLLWKEVAWQHGSLLSISTPAASTRKNAKSKSKEQSSFIPFPELAKNYPRALRLYKRRYGGSSSYTALSHLQESMHTVEPQGMAKLQRLYMSEAAAIRFQKRSATTKPQQYGILLGTYGRERKDKTPKKRTSLSSTTESEEYFPVAKVQAIYETQDPLATLAEKNAPWRQLADHLGLVPIGWVFLYPPDEDDNEDKTVMRAHHAALACQLQIESMKQQNEKNEYGGWVTVAMAATTGATEVFQMSNVAVQMVSEGAWLDNSNNNDNSLLIKTRDPVRVDGKETHQFDTVLCLVNTALLRHDGMFAAASLKLNAQGRLTPKSRQKLVSATSSMVEKVADFHILLALHDMLSNGEDWKDLCRHVKKWAQGQKKSIANSKTLAALQKRIQQALQQ